MKLTRYEKNPILSALPKNNWEALCVLNPGVIYDEENKRFVMLYRAGGNEREHYIYIGLAYSADGYNFVRQSDMPVLAPSIDNSDGGCIEDPRIVKIGEYYYITYASRTYPPGQYWREDRIFYGDRPVDGPFFVRENNTVTHLCMTKDFKNYKKLGRITDSRLDDRDVIIFPEKIGGRFVRLSRPTEWCGDGYPCKKPSMWLAYSDDLIEWDKPEFLMGGVEWWEDKKIGGSCPPIKTKYGWLHIYHGVHTQDHAYRIGAVMLDLHNPLKIIARTKNFFMEPEAEFEFGGNYCENLGCVFPSSNVVKDNILFIYYGAADKHVCVATAKFDDFVEDLMAGKL